MSATFAAGFSCRINAAAPATCAAAAAVPLFWEVHISRKGAQVVAVGTSVDLIFIPGAKRSMQLPVLLKVAMLSVDDEAASIFLLLV
jgi:hypothetical protein